MTTLQGELTTRDQRLVVSVLSGVTALQLATLSFDVVTPSGDMVNHKKDNSSACLVRLAFFRCCCVCITFCIKLRNICCLSQCWAK